MIRAMLIGAAFGMHYWTYFLSLKASTVAIAMLTLFTHPIISGFVEPFYSKKKIDLSQVVLGACMLAGVWFLQTTEPPTGADISFGILTGMVSSVILVFRNIYTKRLMTEAQIRPTSMMFYQLLAAGAVFLPFFTWGDAVLDWRLIGLLSALVLGTTLVGQLIFISSLRVFDATVAGLITCIQPVIGTGYAVWLLDEQITSGTVIGGGILLSSVAAVNIRQLKTKTHG